MSRALVCLGVLLVVAFAGCVEDGKRSPNLSNIYGPDELGPGLNATLDQPGADPNATFLFGQSLEGTIEGGNASVWGPMVDVVIEMPKISLTKTDPGPAGGGGVTTELPAAAVNHTLRVRFVNASKLDGFKAQWSLYHPGAKNVTFGSSYPAEEEMAFPVTEPGAYLVLAQLLTDKGKVVATTASAWRGNIDVHYTIESAVRPVKPSNVPVDPPNYAEHMDWFPFTVPSRLPGFVLETQFRGTYRPGVDGTDVDLELKGPNMEPVCAANTLGAPGPADSDERLEQLNLVPGEWVAGVGGADCNDQYSYNNSGLVPYTANLWLYYSGVP